MYIGSAQAYDHQGFEVGIADDHEKARPANDKQDEVCEQVASCT